MDTSAFYTRAAALFRNLALARADGSIRNLLGRLSRSTFLRLTIGLWRRCPNRNVAASEKFARTVNQVRSLILTSQLPVTHWHEQVGDPTVADGILDRLVHNAHRIEMRSDSMRENRGEPNT